MLCLHYFFNHTSPSYPISESEGWTESCQTPPKRAALGELDVANIYIPDQMPATSDLMSMGNPARWINMRWNALLTTPPPPTQMFLRAAMLAVHLVCRCLHISSPAVGTQSGWLGEEGRVVVKFLYLSKNSWCMFGHMALHFRLFWQPNMIQQPVSGSRFKPRQND